MRDIWVDLNDKVLQIVKIKFFLDYFFVGRKGFYLSLVIRFPPIIESKFFSPHTHISRKILFQTTTVLCTVVTSNLCLHQLLVVSQDQKYINNITWWNEILKSSSHVPICISMDILHNWLTMKFLFSLCVHVHVKWWLTLYGRVPI